MKKKSEICYLPLAVCILDIFEEYLTSKGVTYDMLPNDDREAEINSLIEELKLENYGQLPDQQTINEAISEQGFGLLYGSDYYNLEGKLIDLIQRFID